MNESDQEIRFDEVATAAEALQQGGQPVTVGSLRAALGDVSAASIHKHLSAWRAGQAEPAPAVALPESIAAALGSWARGLVEDTATRLQEEHARTLGDLESLLQLNESVEAERDQARARVADLDASIERLTIELRHARDIASEALVGKAKDQLAIEGKDLQLAELRRQLERQVTASAADSDARLAADMELVGAVTARDNLAAEVASLRAQLDASRTTQRSA